MTHSHFAAYLKLLVNDPQKFTAPLAREAACEIMAGRATNAQIGAFLMALKKDGKEHDPAIIAAVASAMRDAALQIPFSKDEDDKHSSDKVLVDIVGTGGDGQDTFNVSTAAAIVAAGAGCKVAKVSMEIDAYLSSSLPSLTIFFIARKQGFLFEMWFCRCPRSFILQSYQSHTRSSTYDFAKWWLLLSFFPNIPSSYEECGWSEAGTGRQDNIQFVRIAAIPAILPGVHRMPLHSAPEYRLGPLSSPAKPKRVVVGVHSKSIGPLMAEALRLSGVERAWVVCGAMGLDEVILGDCKGWLLLFCLLSRLLDCPRGKNPCMVSGEKR